LQRGCCFIRILASAFTCCPPGQPGFSGGEDTLGWNLVNQIARYHELWVLTQGQHRESIEDFVRGSDAPIIHFMYLSLPRWLAPMLNYQGSHQFYYFLWQILAYFVAVKLHKKFNFSLFHHVTYANDWMASYVGALLPVPYVRGPGGGAHRTPRKFLNQYNLKGRIWEKTRSIGQFCFRKDPFFIVGQRRAKAILLCNKEALDSLPKKWLHKAHLFAVCGVSSDDLGKTFENTSNNGVFKVLSAGKLLPIKGFELTLRAFAIFVAQYPHAMLTIVGSGPELAHLQLLAQKLKVKDKVVFAGWKPREDLLSLMAESDVFLFPSLRDGGGAVVVEAMSMGIPVICLDISGPAMHVTTESGIKVPADSPEHSILGLASGLEELYLDGSKRTRMGESARRRAEDLYHWDKVGERLEVIYQSINHRPA